MMRTWDSSRSHWTANEQNFSAQAAEARSIKRNIQTDIIKKYKYTYQLR